MSEAIGGAVESRILDAALEFIGEGRAPIPLAYGKKTPVDSDWPSLEVTRENVARHFARRRNIGLILGARSGGLCDIDLDCPEAIALAPHFLPPTAAVFGRRSKPNSHWLYISDLHETEEGARIACRDAGKVVLELRIGTEPAQSAVPPSVHESGEAIEWQNEKDHAPARVDGSVLKRAFQRLEIATLLARHWTAGARNDSTNALAGWLSRSNWDFDDAVQIVEAVAVVAGDDDTKGRIRAVRDTYRKVERGKPVTGRKALAKILGAEVVDAIAERLEPVISASQFPDVTKQRMPRGTVLSVKIALNLMEVECSYDMFKLRHLVNGHAIQEFAGLVNDHVVHELRSLIRDKFGFEPRKETVLDAIYTLANHRRFHPVLDYIDTLTWDGQPRIDRWLVTYGGAGDTPYVNAVGALVLIAAVRRVRRPGCKFDEMLVLEGKQGVNKSQALSTLAVKPEWFSDQLPLGARNKEAIEATAGAWIIEVAELQGQRKTDVEKLKAWLSATVDRGRLAYGLTVTEAPRQYILIGTTNSQSYLRDLTGNRRFWPVPVEGFDLEALQRDRDQLWAEASVREAAGASIRLDPSLWEVAAQEQEERVVDNPFLTVLDRVLRQRTDVDGEVGPLMNGMITVDDLWTMLGIRVAQRHQGLMEQLADAMRALGWEKSRRRIDGRRNYVYVRGPEPYRPIGVIPPEADGVPFDAFYDDDEGRVDRQQRRAEREGQREQ